MGVQGDSGPVIQQQHWASQVDLLPDVDTEAGGAG